MTVFRAATLRTFFFAFHAGAKELNEVVTEFVSRSQIRRNKFGVQVANAHALAIAYISHAVFTFFAGFSFLVKLE